MREPVSRGGAKPERAPMRRAIGVLVIAVALLAGGLAAALVVTACGSDDDEAGETTTETTTATQTTTTTTATTQPPPPPSPTELRVRVVDGAPRGGIVRETVDRVVVIVTSNVSDQVHVHGYDRTADVGPGKRARIAFRAKLPGRFVIELEDRHAQIAELTVNP
jgi:hypothetical protein